MRLTITTASKLWILFVLFVIHSSLGEDKDQRTDAQRRQFKELYDRLTPVTIYGKVVDEKGEPLPDTEVKVGWERATYLIGASDFGSEIWVKTDANGRWVFDLSKPSRAFVEDVRKSGYDYSRHDETLGSGRNLVLKKTTYESPVVTIMRRMGQPTFLIYREGRAPMRAQSPHSRTNRLDLMEERPDKMKPDGYEDLRVALNWSAASNSWSLTFSAPGEGAGVIAGTNLLYEAPSEGYREEVSFGEPPWPTYLYLRSRALPVYARVDLTYYPWKGGDTNQVMSIAYKAWVNPFGERNFEYDQQVETSLRVKRALTEESSLAVKSGRRFPRPDIGRRIKETAERVAKEKAEREQKLRQGQ